MTNTLPVSNIVDIDVILSPQQAQAPAINTAIIVGTSTVIDSFTRRRMYTSLTQVAEDFGTTAPEYLAASLWFGQNPSPDTLFIGRWFKNASAGQLIGGPLSAFYLIPSNWHPITTGAFLIYVDHIPYAVQGMNFSTVLSINEVATVIQAGIRAQTGGTETVVFDGVYTRFVVTDDTTGSSSVISFATDPTAIGHVAFSGQPTATTDSITINGTQVTFVSGTPTGNQVQIGLTLAATLTNLVTFLNASTDTNISLINYSVVGTTLYLVSKLPGTAGNAYTLAKVGSTMTLSGATLSGGTGQNIYVLSVLGNIFGNGCYVAPGVDAESALNGVIELDKRYSNQSYGLVVLDAIDSDHEAIAVYVEGVAPIHYYGITTQEGGAIVPGDQANLPYVLKSLNLHHTAIQYTNQLEPTSPYAIASYLARILTTNWLGADTTITLMFKQEPGVTPQNINTAEAVALQEKNCNVYAAYDNGTAFIQYGVSSSGQYTDTVIGADWLAGQIQANVFNTLYGATTKIPQTDAGMGRLVVSAQAACELAVNNGYCGPGVWNASGFGPLKTGQQLNAGYLIYAPPMATQSQAVRATRAGTVMQIAIKTAGAIHSDDIVMTVLQ